MKQWHKFAAMIAAAMLAPGTGAGASELIVDPPGLTGYTLLKPDAHVARPWPIVIWVNGGCRLDPVRYLDLLRAVSDEGFLVIAMGRPGSEMPDGGSADERPRPAPRTLTERLARITPPESRTEQIPAAIDWAQRSAGTKGDSLYGRIATDRVAVMGHSCGGMQALEASLDPRVSTTLVWSSGYWRYGGDLKGIRLNRSMLQALHAPVLYLTGGATDIAHLNAEGDFVEINNIPIVKATSPAPHSLSFSDPRGGIFGEVGIAWLRWWLLDDHAAEALFSGAACGLCTDERWTIERKNIP